MHLIQLKKFGEILTSRQSGKEAYLALQPLLQNASEKEIVEIDFEGVKVLTPSWADEFLTPLEKIYGLKYLNTENSSVKATLEMLKKLEK